MTPFAGDQREKLSAIEFSGRVKYLRIDKKYLEGSGLEVGHRTLFVRRDVSDLFAKLLKDVIEDGSFCWIGGPPGVGKSFATYVLLCTCINSNLIITWIYFNHVGSPSYVRFNGEIKSTGKVPISTMDFLAFMEHEEFRDKMHIVIQDGYNEKDMLCISVRALCSDWFEKDTAHRRDIVISSSGSPPGMHAAQKVRFKFTQISICSWTKSECKEAVQDGAFFEQVKSRLDGHITTIHTHAQAPNPEASLSKFDLTPEDLIESKFHFAGGSSRYMFDMSTEDVIRDIAYYVDRCEDLYPYLSGMLGSSSSIAVNHLLSTYPSVRPHQRRHVPISAYAAALIAEKLGPNLVSQLRKTLESERNSELDGHLFEMWFFAKLKASRTHIMRKWAQSRNIFTRWCDTIWECSTLIDFDPEKDVPPISLTEGTWLRPTKWNQGGFDAVFIEPHKSAVTFAQVIRANEHSFKSHFFKSLLVTIKVVWGIDIKFLDIYFVISKATAQTFQIKQPSEIGLFEDYKVPQDNSRWTRNSELKCAQICYLPDNDI